MTQKAKHTPAPWELYSPHPAEQYVDQVSGDGKDRKSIFRIHHDDDIAEAEAEANARLIAAAPDLLQALETCAHYLYRFYALAIDRENDPRFQLEWATIRLAWAVIAKAKGGAA